MVAVRLATSGLEDPAEIQRHYDTEGVPDAGRRIVAEIINRIQRLAEHPESGRVVPEFGSKNLRELIHPPFRIVYWREPEYVSIVRVWRSERLLRLP